MTLLSQLRNYNMTYAQIRTYRVRQVLQQFFVQFFMQFFSVLHAFFTYSVLTCSNIERSLKSHTTSKPNVLAGTFFVQFFMQFFMHSSCILHAHCSKYKAVTEESHHIQIECPSWNILRVVLHTFFVHSSRALFRLVQNIKRSLKGHTTSKPNVQVGTFFMQLFMQFFMHCSRTLF